MNVYWDKSHSKQKRQRNTSIVASLTTCRGDRLGLGLSRWRPKHPLNHPVTDVQLVAQLLHQLLIGVNGSQLAAKGRHFCLNMLEATTLLFQELDPGIGHN